MTRIFVDANIFFAAVASRIGGSYYILELAKRKKIEIVTVLHALAEAERNIEKKLGIAALKNHYDNILAIQPIIQSLIGLLPDFEKTLIEFVPEKDIPILAGVLESGVEILITLDQAHFLKNIKLRDKFPRLKIVTPGDFLREFLSHFEKD